MTRRKLPPHSSDLERVLTCLAAGTCCSIVGLSNTGKSSLLRLACMPAVRQRLVSNAPASAFFYVDCNLMLTMSEQGFYEATLRAVQAELPTLAAPPALIEQIGMLYRRVVEPSSAFVIPLSFNESVMALCEHLERRVVFVFDEFDEPFARLDGRVFLNLRALRDKYGPGLCFITATEKALTDGRGDAEAAEFSELFAGCTHFIRLLPPDEGRQLVLDLARRDAITLNDDEVEFILSQCGGHPGLLVATTNVLLRVLSDVAAEMRRHALTWARQSLDSDAAVRAECNRLWRQLSEADQSVLLYLLTAIEPSAPLEHARQRLVEYGLLLETPAPAVFSPLFENYARRQFRARLPAQSGVYVDVDSGDVWVDGRKAPTLTDLEYRLLLLLYGRIDKICDKYQVVEAVWGTEFIDEVDDARIEKLVSRLRQKLEADPANPRYFQTVRGRGYRLISG